MSYQPSTPSLASSAFVSEVQAFARELHASVPHDEADGAFLQDVARGRYPMVALQRLMAIAARSEKPEHHEILSEIVRPLGAAPRCVATVFDAETLANGDANLAQIQFERVPCKSTAQRVREKLLRQMATTRWALDVVSSRQWQ